MKKFKRSMLERTNIETNKQFQRLSEKTQVLVPQNGLTECTKNRLTHSYEVATSSLLIATDIAERLNLSVSEIDYQFALNNVSLLHDIGQCAFGHDGQSVLSDLFIGLGLEEGFDDNNNNLVVLEKNNLLVSDYTTASLIKYPHKLYENQKKYYMGLLNTAIDEDREHFAKIKIDLKDQKRTIACQIMDEADRNSYVCSDLADFFCLGNTISMREMRMLAKTKKLDLECSEFNTLANMIKSNSKTAIKAYFNDLKNRFNLNYTITPNGLQVVDHDLNDYREFLSDVEWIYFIEPKQKSERNINNLKYLKTYAEYVIANNYYPSKTYKNLIENAKTEVGKLIHIRNMVGENTDWYIINFNRKTLAVKD